jgi:hypothetical protein
MNEPEDLLYDVPPIPEAPAIFKEPILEYIRNRLRDLTERRQAPRCASPIANGAARINK